jgi:hypothetical protein
MDGTEQQIPAVRFGPSALRAGGITNSLKSVKSQPPNDKKTRRVLWYATQAKTGLEWGTQRSLPTLIP